MNEQQSHHLHKLHTGFQFPALVWQTWIIVLIIIYDLLFYVLRC